MRPGCEGESAAGPQLLSAPKIFLRASRGPPFSNGLFRPTVSAWVFRASRGIMRPMPDTTDDTAEIVETTGGQTILVVDDMSDNIILISLSLQDMGYRVV